MHAITTISFFRFDQLKNKFWGLGMMVNAHPMLQNIKGQSFYKLMGSGIGIGFIPIPDLSVYILIQCWENIDDAHHFFSRSQIIKKYKEKCADVWTIYMKNIYAHGEWNSINPFNKSLEIDQNISYVASLTRATIVKRKLFSFWAQVPSAQKQLYNNNGLIMAKGIAEIPLAEMATFSIWENAKALENFAYRSKGHQKAMKNTRKYGWFKEDLFARFQPFLSVGKWRGKVMLPEIAVEEEVLGTINDKR